MKNLTSDKCRLPNEQNIFYYLSSFVRPKIYSINMDNNKKILLGFHDSKNCQNYVLKTLFSKKTTQRFY